MPRQSATGQGPDHRPNWSRPPAHRTASHPPIRQTPTPGGRLLPRKRERFFVVRLNHIRAEALRIDGIDDVCRRLRSHQSRRLSGVDGRWRDEPIGRPIAPHLPSLIVIPEVISPAEEDAVGEIGAAVVTFANGRCDAPRSTTADACSQGPCTRRLESRATTFCFSVKRRSSRPRSRTCPASSNSDREVSLAEAGVNRSERAYGRDAPRSCRCRRPVASAFALTTSRTDGFFSFEQPAGIDTRHRPGEAARGRRRRRVPVTRALRRSAASPTTG